MQYYLFLIAVRRLVPIIGTAIYECRMPDPGPDMAEPADQFFALYFEGEMPVLRLK